MKKLYLLIIAAVLLPRIGLFARNVIGIPYQTVVRDSQGNPMPNEELTIRFYIQRILSTKDDAVPATLYSETHTVMTDANGMVCLQVGTGTPLEGNFATLDWWGKIFIKTELELTGSNESVFTTTQELATVPYALSAEAVLLAKDSVKHALNTGIDDGIDYEEKNGQICLTSQDFAESLQAFIEKRPPNFRNR